MLDLLAKEYDLSRSEFIGQISRGIIKIEKPSLPTPNNELDKLEREPRDSQFEPEQSEVDAKLVA